MRVPRQFFAWAGIGFIVLVVVASITIAESINSKFRRLLEGQMPERAEHYRTLWRRFHAARNLAALAASEDVSGAGMTKANETMRTRPSASSSCSVRSKNRRPFNSGRSDALRKSALPEPRRLLSRPHSDSRRIDHGLLPLPSAACHGETTVGADRPWVWAAFLRCHGRGGIFGGCSSKASTRS